MKSELIDIIGDIHGEAAVPRDLLARLGYTERAGCYRHPRRRVIFLGDYIDRGPAIRETLHIVRAMVEHESAIALCGNHELDVLMYDTPDRRGGWLRSHGEQETALHARTRAEFAAHPHEWKEWLRWFQSLPLFLEIAGLRAVHACWDSEQAAVIRGQWLDIRLLHAIAERTSAESVAACKLLKGPEGPLPGDILVPGGEGGLLTKMRVRWWEDGRGQTYRRACINRHGPGPDIPISREFDTLLGPPPGGGCPVFIGHYWMPPGPPAPLTPTIACLDYSVAVGGPLVAYRWDGEQRLNPEKFVFDPARLPSGKESPLRVKIQALPL